MGMHWCTSCLPQKDIPASASLNTYSKFIKERKGKLSDMSVKCPLSSYL